MGGHAQEFMDALHGLEEDGELDGLVSKFSEEAELRNPNDETAHHGREGAKTFWDTYRRSFAEIRSDFHNVTESDGTVMLEWTSRGRLTDDTSIEYDGVSVVEYDGDRIRRFRTYFDPAKLGDQIT